MIQIRNQTRLLLARATAGDTFTHNGQDFEVVAVSRYQTPDRRNRLVVTLTGRCAVCGQTYQATTGRSPSWIPRTCPAHRWQAPRRDHAGAAALPQDRPVEQDGSRDQAATTEANQGAPVGQKRCAKCGGVFSLDRFYRHRDRPDGRDGYCMECRKGNTNKARGEKRAAGLCVECGRDAGGDRYCTTCIERRWDQKHGLCHKPVPTERRCTTCGQVKPVSAFYRRAWGPSSSCKACQIQRQAERSAHWRKLGLCGRCGGPVEPGAATCPKCLDRRRRREGRHVSGSDSLPDAASGK